jgi:hypothetical protein
MSLHTQGLWGNPQGQGETTAAWSLYSGASEMGPLHTRRGQAEDHAKASWRIRASARGVGLQKGAEAGGFPGLPRAVERSRCSN